MCECFSFLIILNDFDIAKKKKTKGLQYELLCFCFSGLPLTGCKDFLRSVTIMLHTVHNITFIDTAVYR